MRATPVCRHHSDPDALTIFPLSSLEDDQQ